MAETRRKQHRAQRALILACTVASQLLVAPLPAAAADVLTTGSESEPVGPQHALSIGPSPLYDGDAATVSVTLTPAPTGGTLELYATSGTVGVEPTLIGTAPAAGTVEFGITAAQARRYFTVFSGSETDPPSRSSELQPTILLPPNSRIGGPNAWTFAAATALTFGVTFGAVTPVEFECAIDGGDWFDCVSPYTTPPLADGRHTFGVRATDANGRVEPVPEEATWRIDTSPPVVTSVDVLPRDIYDPFVTLEIAATDQTIGNYGQEPQVFLSMRPDVSENGRLEFAAQRPLSAPTFRLTALQWGGSEAAGTRTIYVQVEDAFGLRAAPIEPLTVQFDPHWHPFADIRGNRFEADISWLWREELTEGCAMGLYCPSRTLTRAQIATFLVRALDLPPTDEDFFTDDQFSVHHNAINRLAASGITSGCGRDRYCPSRTVTRAQVATFLVRAFGLPHTSQDFFDDDESSPHERNINRLAASGITTGCGPDRFCPNTRVRRDQMAALLHRAHD